MYVKFISFILFFCKSCESLSVHNIVINTLPALCTACVVAPISYSIDKAIVESTNKPICFNKEVIKTLGSVKCLTSNVSIITFFGLFSTFLITNMISSRNNRIALSFFCLTPFGVRKDINLARTSNSKIHNSVYFGFIIRDIISLISALVFPANIPFLVHYWYMLLLQIPQTFFHQIGIEYSNNNSKKKIIKKNFLNNVFMRSIKNLIQYGIGLKMNIYILNNLNKIKFLI